MGYCQKYLVFREVQRLLDEKFQRPVAEKTKAYVAPKKQQCVVPLKVSMLIPPFIQWHRILDIFPILVSTLGALAQNLRAEARYYFTLVRSLTIRWSKHRCSIRADDALLSMPALAILAIDIHYDEVQLNQGGTLTRKRNGSIERTTRDERAEAVGLDRMRGDNGDWQDIDVEQPNAVGPWLRAQVTKSKPGWDQ